VLRDEALQSFDGIGRYLPSGGTDLNRPSRCQLFGRSLPKIAGSVRRGIGKTTHSSVRGGASLEGHSDMYPANLKYGGFARVEK
jgi:hypothetical protein